ncbi:MAG: putative toxin-antitoxin system toxin component, PIN family [Desulfuromonadaceae bacterium GWB2_53_15]|nr:MAG: putative toxin-antitoxin system toxin component, PIN family [Desulfuromonadales bacterium GWD2_54_10]OHB25849.1 MAG: putative toxin-antitoxin system toxin component, PIN family [Desulfuromonadaceae bacterium GWB2_53_15]
MGKKIAPQSVVIDTNVLVSCFLFGGRLERLRELWQAKTIIPLVSRETFDELRRVLSYPKFSLSSKEIRTIIDAEILPYFEVVEIKSEIRDVCRDPHDDKFLAVAANGMASWLITGDKDLLVLQVYRQTKIITPGEFLKQIEKTQGV